jgi:hypothetical protein
MTRISSRLQAHGLLGALAGLVLTDTAGCSGTLEYRLSIVLDPPANESGLCGDKLDSDAGFLIDTLDPDSSSPG